MLRYSGLGLATLVSLLAIVTFKESGGWYVLVTALLFGIEMFSRRAGLAEAGMQVFFAGGIYLLLQEANMARGYQWLGIALALLGTDLVLARTYPDKRPIAWFSRGLGALVVLVNTLDLLLNNVDPRVSAICFAIYALFFLAQTFLYRQPLLGYSFTLYAVLTVIFTLQTFDQSKWMLPVTLLAVVYYAVGFALRKQKTPNDTTSEESPATTKYLIHLAFCPVDQRSGSRFACYAYLADAGRTLCRHTRRRDSHHGCHRSLRTAQHLAGLSGQCPLFDGVFHSAGRIERRRTAILLNCHCSAGNADALLADACRQPRRRVHYRHGFSASLAEHHLYSISVYRTAGIFRGDFLPGAGSAGLRYCHPFAQPGGYSFGLPRLVRVDCALRLAARHSDSCADRLHRFHLVDARHPGRHHARQAQTDQRTLQRLGRVTR